MRISDWSSDVCSSDLAAPDFEILHDPLANNGDDGAYRYRPPLSRHGHQEQRLHLQFREYRSEADSGLLDPAGAISVHHDLQSERNRARAAPASRCDIQLTPRMGRSEDGRVGKEGVSRGGSRGSE